MSTLQKLSLALVGSAIVFMSVKPASAVTLKAETGGIPVAGQGLFSNVSGAQTIDFNNGVAPTTGFATYSSPGSTKPAIVQGSLSGQYAEPAGDNSDYLTISPTSSNVTGNTGSVTINFAKALDYFGLYWGSVDAYNSISFYNGDTLLKTFTGKDVPGTTASGNWTSPTDNLYVNFFADQAESFNKIVMSSTAPAFESDNHAFRQAPEPSAMLGLLAFGAVSAGSALKRKQKQVV